MATNNRKIKIAYLGGGSRNWARTFMNDLAKEDAFTAEVYLYDIDVAAAKDNEIIANRLFNRKDVVGKHKFVVAEDLKDAVVNSDFVVISILPGTFEEMRSDVHTPEKYGIYQSVGDTTGPGGNLRALRTIPIYKTFAEAIKEYCPKAWVINYTNPMSMCVKTLYEVFPEIKAFGCCHEVFSSQSLLAYALKWDKGISIGRNDVKINVSGINHFTWITEAKYREYDLLDSYKRYSDAYYDTGIRIDAVDWRENPLVCYNRVKFDLFRRFGAMAAAGDRHLSEFCPGKWYLENPQKVAEWQFALTSVDYRVKELDERLQKTKALVNGEEEIKVGYTGEEGVHMIKAICGLGDMISNCNMPNRGQAEDLDYGAIVETNASFTADSVKPITSGKLPSNVRTLVSRVSSNQTQIVKAALKYDYETVFQCFANDPLVGGISHADAKKLYLEMIENTKAYIPHAEEYLNKNS